MRGVINAVGTVVAVLAVFWIIGLLTKQGTGAAAVGGGIRETIDFFVRVINSI